MFTTSGERDCAGRVDQRHSWREIASQLFLDNSNYTIAERE